MANYNLSLPAETIDELLLWLDDKQGIIIKQTDLLSGTGQSTTGTMTQKAITDALGTKADADSVYTKTETDNLLADKVDKVPDALTGEIPVFDGDGGLEGSNKFLSDYATQDDLDEANARIDIVAGEAGLAEAVIDTDGVGTEQEFTFRKSGGDGGAYYRKIKGKTLAWNQIINPANFENSKTINGVHFTNNGDGSVSVYTDAGGATADTQFQGLITLFLGHKIVMLGCPAGGSASTYYLTLGNLGNDIGNGFYNASVPSWAAGLISFPRISIKAGIIIATPIVFRPQVFDLTQMFGAGNEPSSVAEFEALYPDAYYGYNAGKLKNNDAEAVETTGVNQWDEEWEIGAIDQTTGANIPHGAVTRSTNYIHVFPSVVYYIKHNAPFGVRLFYYDISKALISSDTVLSVSRTFTTPADCAYLRFQYSGTTYNHDICINISNAAINGQYFPYWKRDLQLNITTRKDTDGNVPFADGMKGAGTAADWADKVGGEIVMDKVDLATLTFQATGSTGTLLVTTALANLIKKPSTNSIAPNAVCSNRVVCPADTLVDGGFTIDINGAIYYKVADNTQTSVTGELVYQRATPVPFTWAEPLNLGVKVDENGTERAVAPEGATAPSAPFVADTTYTMSVARMVEILKNL